MHETSIMLHMVSIFKSLMLSGISLISLVVTSFLSFLIDTEETTQAPPKFSSFSYEAVSMHLYSTSKWPAFTTLVGEKVGPWMLVDNSSLYLNSIQFSYLKNSDFSHWIYSAPKDTTFTPTDLNQDLGFVHKCVHTNAASPSCRWGGGEYSEILAFKIGAKSAFNLPNNE